MEIKELEYVRVDALSLEELEEFEELCCDQGYDVSDTAYGVNNFWRHYGVYCSMVQGYDTEFQNNCGVDITEQFLNYLNSLEGVKDAPNVEDHETQETPTEYLTVKERLLALVDGKELEWFHICEYDNTNDWVLLESFQQDFGDILYDDECKVRVKVEKDDLTLSFERFCDSLGLPAVLTSNLFKFYKAGYETAKNND